MHIMEIWKQSKEKFIFPNSDELEQELMFYAGIRAGLALLGHVSHETINNELKEMSHLINEASKKEEK